MRLQHCMWPPHIVIFMLQQPTHCKLLQQAVQGVPARSVATETFQASVFPKQNCALTLFQLVCRAGSCQANWARSGYWDSTFRQMCCAMWSSCCLWTSPCALDLQLMVWTSVLASSWMKSVCHSRCGVPCCLHVQCKINRMQMALASLAWHNIPTCTDRSMHCHHFYLAEY